MFQYALNTQTSVKIVEVQAGAELSKQYHHQRAELWVMLDPGLVVELDGRTWEAKVGEEIWIPVGAVHRLTAPGNGGRLLEVAFGHFDEADIVRLSDRYGRTA
jgi:mannose-1-phosphate guanylyltransferase/mannose-6-phosphate isomerase